MDHSSFSSLLDELDVGSVSIHSSLLSSSGSSSGFFVLPVSSISLLLGFSLLRLGDLSSSHSLLDSSLGSVEVSRSDIEFTLGSINSSIPKSFSCTTCVLSIFNSLVMLSSNLGSLSLSSPQFLSSLVLSSEGSCRSSSSGLFVPLSSLPGLSGSDSTGSSSSKELSLSLLDLLGFEVLLNQLVSVFSLGSGVPEVGLVGSDELSEASTRLKSLLESNHVSRLRASLGSHSNGEGGNSEDGLHDV